MCVPRALPGVHLVLTGADIKRLAKPPHAKLDKQKNPACKDCEWYALAQDTVRYCGDGIAAVIADNR